MRILMTGAGHFLDRTTVDGHTHNELMTLSGGNSGNYMIGHGAMYHLRKAVGDTGAVTYMKLRHLQEKDKTYLEENFDAVVLAGANMINERANFGFVFRALKDVDLPVMAFGVGAQAESNQVELTPPRGTVNFMKLIAERSSRIGVRGEYTANVLSKAGIKNVEVVGCPSYYINSHDKDFQIKLPSRDEINAFKISMTMKRDRNKYHADKLLKQYQRRMFKEGIAGDHKFVVQTEMLEGRMGFTHEVNDEDFKNICAYFRPEEKDLERTREWLKANVGIFFSYEQWSDFLDDVSFSYGARFHGNMMALMKGIPTLGVTHDSRTRELCDFLNIPSRPIEELVDSKATMLDLYDELDYSDFNSKYHGLCDRFERFMADNLGKHPGQA